MQNFDGFLYPRKRYIRLLLERMPNLLRLARIRTQCLLLHATKLPRRHFLPRRREVRQRPMRRRLRGQGNHKLDPQQQNTSNSPLLRHRRRDRPIHPLLLLVSLQKTEPTENKSEFTSTAWMGWCLELEYGPCA